MIEKNRGVGISYKNGMNKKGEPPLAAACLRGFFNLGALSNLSFASVQLSYQVR